MFQFLQTILQFLDRENIAYMLSGSMAMSIYTLPRATRDFDFVIHLQAQDIEKITTQFKEGYYCEGAAIQDAIRHNSLFNIIDHATGFKADFMILKDQPFRQKEFERRTLVDFFGMPVYVVTAEDLLISKIIWIQELQSAMQMEDIKNLQAVEGLDWAYIHHWISDLQLNAFNLL